MLELLEDYCDRKKFPIWLEYHAEQLARELKRCDYPEKKKKQILKEEHGKILEFCGLMEDPDMAHKEAEAQVWPESVEFYKEYEKERRDLERYEAEQKRLREQPVPTHVTKKKTVHLSNKLYLEKELSQKEKDKLLSKGYSRLKISPFGTSGAAYYWVRRRYNESKEHAFFCYILEAELKKHVQKVKLNVNSGPDAVIEHDGKKYCFDVETGKSLSRQPKYLRHKFSQYKQDYAQSFILVTKKSLKFKYAKYGEVITRGKLRKTLAKLFKRADQRHIVYDNI